MTYYEACRDVQSRLTIAGVPEPVIDARYLLEFVTGWTEAQYLLERNSDISGEELEKLNELVGRRCKREPLQYIIGSQEFMGLPFICTADCLIPRQDTEILVEHAMKAIENVKKKYGHEPEVLDLCTGSGCVIISLAKICGLKAATGSDISKAALKVARRNADMNEATVRLIESDLFEAIEGQFDIITANPPYIDTGLIHGLIPEIWEYEPMVALDGGDDGLIFYRRIIKEAPAHLRREGKLLFEIGDTQGNDVSELMRNGGFTDVKVHKDLAGLDRVVEGICLIS